MLFAMRNTDVTAVVNIDAANFSTRSRLREIPFYSPRLLRVPFLYIATAATKKGLDLFEDFAAMRFSTRYEVIVHSPELRHHDLSDFGRGVTAPLGIRGEAQAVVQQHYADVQAMTVRFLKAHLPTGSITGNSFGEWLKPKQSPGTYTVEVHPGAQPAPTTAKILETLGRNTPAVLRQARSSDPAAELFQVNDLERIVTKALAMRAFQTARELADFALELHPDSPIFYNHKSSALEGAGDTAGAAESATACAGKQAGNDWRASVALLQCKERLERLTSR